MSTQQFKNSSSEKRTFSPIRDIFLYDLSEMTYMRHLIGREERMDPGRIPNRHWALLDGRGKDAVGVVANQESSFGRTRAVETPSVLCFTWLVLLLLWSVMSY